ncbi:MAG TPA: hypothetical protein VH477_16615 [Bryobacteraceae bacterium]|jgi:hypothetical protein
MSERGLDDLFERYRAACPEVEPGPNFMPSLWQKIEARQSFWSVFGRFGKRLTTASAALCLLLLALNLFFSPGALNVIPTYADALMADHSAESTDYGEAIRSNTPEAPPER